ncbi:importin subunit alpha-1a-like protein, partial [Tanacetum coccineum]
AKVNQSGIVPQLVEFLGREDSAELQLEAAWALTNIASGTSDHTKAVTANGTVPIFVNLLASANDRVCQQAMRALGNIAGDSLECRNLVLQEGALDKLLDQLDDPKDPEMFQNAAWALSNFCRSKPQLPCAQTTSALKSLWKLIRSNDEQVLKDACWALSYLSDGTNDNIQAVIDSDVFPTLVKLLKQCSPSVLIPALRTVGNIATGDDNQTSVHLRLHLLVFVNL